MIVHVSFVVGTAITQEPDADGHEIVGASGVARDVVTSTAAPHADHSRPSCTRARNHSFEFAGKSAVGVHVAVPPEARDVFSHTVVGDDVDEDVKRANCAFSTSASESFTATDSAGRAAPTNFFESTVMMPATVGAAGVFGARL